MADLRQRTTFGTRYRLAVRAAGLSAALLAAGGALVALTASSPSRERALVADLLRERHLIDGVPWSQMAVLVRSGALVPEFVKPHRQFERRDVAIPHQQSSPHKEAWTPFPSERFEWEGMDKASLFGVF